MPRKTMDGYLSDLVRDAVRSEVQPLIERITALEKQVAREKSDASSVAEKLIPQKEARHRLGVNEASFRNILKQGSLAVVTTPNGRQKIVESSLNEYIRELQEKAG